MPGNGPPQIPKKKGPQDYTPGGVKKRFLPKRFGLKGQKS